MADFGFYPEGWKPYAKGSLLGFFSLEVRPFGLYIHDCSFFQKGDRFWVNFPSKPPTQEGGKWGMIMDIPIADNREKFQAAVVPRVKELAGIRD